MRWGLILLFLVVLTACTKAPECVPIPVECDPCPEPDPCPACVCPEFDKSLCPVIENNITTVKYMYYCSDGRKVDKESECKPPTVDLVPDKTHEDKSNLIQTASIDPKCVGGMVGGMIYFEVLRRPLNVTIQLSQGDGFTDHIDYGQLSKGYKYFIVCEGKCYSSSSDFNLNKDTYYLMRLKFNFGDIGGIHYSNEYLIDTRTGGDYNVLSCSS